MISRVRHGAAGADLFDSSEAASLLVQARALANADALKLKPLKGVRIALLSANPQNEVGQEFVQAATALGANVSLVQPGLDDLSSAQEVESTAKVLGQLYDAVECQNLPVALVARIARSVQIPVFAGLATPAHPTDSLADELNDQTPRPLRRRRILQAVLLTRII